MSEENQQIQKKKVYFFYHNDSFESNKFLFLKLYTPNFSNPDPYGYIILVKQAVRGDKFYIPLTEGYVKVWNDSKDNVLFFESTRPLEIFTRAYEVFFSPNKVTVNNHIVDCGNRKIQLTEFDILTYLMTEHSEAFEPFLYILCNKLY